MSTEYSVDLPPRYEYNPTLEDGEQFQLISDYILQLHTALEDTLKDLFIRLSDTADSATANNIAFVDEDGNVIDSGKDVSTDGTLGDDSDDSVPTEKAVKTYVDGEIGGIVGLPSSVCSFLIKPTSLITNIVSGAQRTIAYDLEIFDIGSNFNTGTYTFTAPQTGRYQLNASVLMSNIDVTVSFVELLIKTSNRNYEFTIYPDILLSADDNYASVYSVVADMDANDTAWVTIFQNVGGANQMDISANSYFSGSLI